MSGIPSWAVRGAKVVCVDDVLGRSLRPAIPVKKGRIYTIDVAWFEDEVGGAFVDLVEAGKGWKLIRFRPVVEPKTEAEDVALFRKLLTQNVPEAA